MLDAHEGFLSTLGKPCVRLNKRIAFPLVAACALFSLYLLSTVFFLDERNLPTLVIPSKDKSPGLRPCFGPDGDVVSANLADTMVIDGRKCVKITCRLILMLVDDVYDSVSSSVCWFLP